jgi:DNA-binding CsgD family transcriptional regulator
MARKREENATLGDLLVQSKITNRLMAAQLREKISQQELVRLLVGTGASHQEIAEVLNTTPGTVATTIQRLKKRGKPNQEGGASEIQEPST